MTISRRTMLAATTSVLAGSAFAQDQFPSRPIEIVVPATAGGGADKGARVMAALLKDPMGQPVVVDNRAGAGGSIAFSYVARAPKDGYTVAVVTDSTVLNPLVQPDARYTLEDFQLLSTMYMGGMALAVANDFPARNLQEFIAHVRKQPKLSVGMFGTVSSPRIACEIFLAEAKIDITPVPYKGEVEAIRDVVAGITPAFFGTTPSMVELHRTGKLRILANSLTERVKILSDVPTFAEQGLKTMTYRWFHGLALPAGTPKPIVDRYVKELGPIIASEKFRAGLGADLMPVTMSPAEFTALATATRARAAQIIKDRNLKA